MNPAPPVPSPLRVGIVAYGLDRPATGIARYAVELVRALRAHRPAVEVVLLKPFAGAIPGLTDGPADAPGEEEPAARLPLCRLLPALMAVGPAAIAAAARRHRLHVVHDPAGVSPFGIPRRLGRFARVVTIHDLVPFVHPETHAPLTNLLFRHYIPRTLPAVDRIVTPSRASGRDIARFYPGFPADRVAVIPNGIGPRFGPRPAAEVRAVAVRYGLAAPYLLAVGALQPRKDLGTALDAVARLRAAGFPHRLAVVGPRAWKSAGVFARVAELGLEDAVTLTGYVADADLPALYAGAACFLYPSLYEGFGLPPLEAMACGAPVVVAATSALPEVVGDAALTVAPRDVAGFVGAIRRVLEEPGLADALRARGLARAGAFTWERAAAEHVALYAAARGR